MSHAAVSAVSAGLIAAAAIGLLPSPASTPISTPTPAPAPPTIFELSGPLHDLSPAFTPDGRTVYFTQGSPAASTIVVSHLAGECWSTPVVAPFSGAWRDFEPAMSPDGAYLIFVSNRPKAGSVAQPLDAFYQGKEQPGGGGNFWRVTRQGTGWSEAVRLPDIVNRTTGTFSPAIARDGSLYFMEPDAKTSDFRLYRAAFRDGAYQTPEPLPFSDGTFRDVDPAIAPDESFIIFSSNRPPAKDLDLFIAFQREGRWSAPEHMGMTVNAAGSDIEARLSPDARTLYFSSTRVTPVTYPRSIDAAPRDLLRLRAWDNGLANIWRVDLSPWLPPLAEKAEKPTAMSKPKS
jgi:Tol biopolymer transport system component